MASRSSTGQQAVSPPQRTTASVLEFCCLFTHDLKRKQKRWQDGTLRYHAFNGKAVVHDERGNLVGDVHAGEEPAEGDEMRLERGGGCIVQVSSGVVARREQDLSAVVDKRVAEREERARLKAAAARERAGVRMGVVRSTPAMGMGMGMGGGMIHTPARTPAVEGDFRHRPLQTVIGTPTGHHGRALVPSESPYEQRLLQQQQQISMNHTANEAPTPVQAPAAKRRRYEDDSPPSKAGYAQNLFGTKLYLGSQPASSLQSLRAAASQRVAERSRAEAQEEEARTTTRPTARGFGRPALGASRSQEIVLSDDEDDVAPPAEVYRKEPLIPTARAAVRPIVNTPRRSAVGQLVRQSIDKAIQQQSPQSIVPSKQPAPEERQLHAVAKEQQRRLPDPVPSDSEIIDIDADDEPASVQVPAPRRKDTNQRKKNQLLSLATERGSLPHVDAKQTARVSKDATLSRNRSEFTEKRPSRDPTPVNDEPRTELRIKSRKKRGLLMVTEKVAPPKPAPKKQDIQPAERESSATLDVEKSDPFASSPEPPARNRSAHGRNGDSSVEKTAAPRPDAIEDIAGQVEQGLDLFDDAAFPLSDIEEPVTSRVLKDCTNTVQARSKERREAPKSPRGLQRHQLSESKQAAAAPTIVDVASEEDKEEVADTARNFPPPISQGDSDNVPIVRKRAKSDSGKRSWDDRPDVPEVSDDEEEPVPAKKPRSNARKRTRKATPILPSEPSDDEEEPAPIPAKKIKKLSRNDSRDTSVALSPYASSDEEIRPRQRSKRAAQRRRREESVVVSSDEPSDHAPPPKTRPKRRRQSKARDEVEELEALRDDEDDESEDMPPPPKKRTRQRSKKANDDDSSTSTKEPKAPAPRLARLSRKSVKSRELIGFMFDEPKGPLNPLIGMARAQFQEAGDASVEQATTEGNSIAKESVDTVIPDVPPKTVVAREPSPEAKPVETVTNDTLKLLTEEPKPSPEVKVVKTAAALVTTVKKAPTVVAKPDTPVSVPVEPDRPSTAVAKVIAPAIEVVQDQPNPIVLSRPQEAPRTVNGIRLPEEPTIKETTAEPARANPETKLPGAPPVTKELPTVPRLPRDDSALSTKSAPAESTPAQPDRTDENPCQPAPQRPANRLFRRQASVGMALPTSTTGVPRIANPASRGRKAALKSDAAGQVPQSILSAATLYGSGSGSGSVVQVVIQEAPVEAPPPKKIKKMTFPGFQPAGGSGPWSREAFDLLETGRPL